MKNDGVCSQQSEHPQYFNASSRTEHLGECAALCRSSARTRSATKTSFTL